MREKVVTMRNCGNCANCLITKDRNLYECWIEDYFYKVEPDQPACEIYIDRAKEERERLKWQKENMPELFDETGQMWKDRYILLEKMEEAQRRLNNNRNIIIMPTKPWEMPDDIYKEYKEIAKILSDFWVIGKEKNSLKIRNFSRTRLDPDDAFQMLLKNILFELRSGRDRYDIAIYIVCEGMKEEYSGDNFAVLSLIRKFFSSMEKGDSYEEFVEDAVRRAPDDKKIELRGILSRHEYGH